MSRFNRVPNMNLLTWTRSLVIATSVFFCGLACNPGQCLRQSDCPRGSKCKEGMCRAPAPAKSTSTKDPVSDAPQSSASENAPSEPSATSVSDDQGATLDAAASAVLEQSSNVDSATDTATTLAP